MGIDGNGKYSVKRFPKVSQRRPKLLDDLWNDVSLDPPETLYHYCSADSFKSILETRTVRLSPLCSMNDYMEDRWLQRLTRENMDDFRSRYKKTKSRVDRTRFYDRVLVRLEKQMDRVPPYVFCLSEDDDVLSQWKGYAADGTGFAIGFESMTFGFSGETSRLRKVCYDPAEHLDVIRHLLDFAYGCLKDGSDHDITVAAQVFVNCVSEPSAFCKNPKFSMENEWRLLYDASLYDSTKRYSAFHIYPANDSGFRIKNAELVHYLSVPFSNEVSPPIREIVLGPKNPAREQPHGLRMFLEKYGYGDLADKLRASKATYR